MSRRLLLPSALSLRDSRLLGVRRARVLHQPARIAPAKDSPQRPIKATSLGGNLTLISGAGGNVVTLGSKETGALMVDGGSAERSGALLKEVAKATGTSKVGVLINTHWHPDQTGSNERLGKSGATIISHENTKLWLGRPIKTSWPPKPFGPLPPKARPTKTTYTNDAIQFAGEDVQYGYMLQAHTDGDIYVYFKNANVLVAGGVVSADGWPRLDWETGGWIAGLVAGYDKLAEGGERRHEDRAGQRPGARARRPRRPPQDVHDHLRAGRRQPQQGARAGRGGCQRTGQGIRASVG